MTVFRTAALIGAVLVFAGCDGGPAAAAESTGCAAVNAGGLSMASDNGRTAGRSAVLAAGESVSVVISGPDEARATLTATAGAGSGHVLLTQSPARSAAFTAASPGAALFSFSADGGPLSLSATCQAAAESGQPNLGFVRRRAERLSNEEPDRARIERREASLLTGDKPGAGVLDVDEDGRPRRMALSISMNELAAASHPGAKPADAGPLDFWIEGRLQNSAVQTFAAEHEDRAHILYFGSSYKLQPEIMFGAIAQLDQMRESGIDGAGVISAGRGWMAGPYMSWQLAPGVILDGRAAWGAVETNVDAGAGTVGYSGGRQLMRSRLTGTRDLGAWRFTPSVGVSYFDEGAATSHDRDAETQSTLGQVDVLPALSQKIELNRDAFVEPSFAVGGAWTFEDSAATQDADPVRLKAHAGVAVGVKDGANLKASGGVESGGEAATDAWSGRLDLKVPIN